MALRIVYQSSRFANSLLNLSAHRHTVIQYRDYKHLNENSFREELQQLSFNDIIPESNGYVNASLEK